MTLLKLKAHCSKEYLARRKSVGFRFNHDVIVELIGEAVGVEGRTARWEVMHILWRYDEVELIYWRNMSDERAAKLVEALENGGSRDMS